MPRWQHCATATALVCFTLPRFDTAHAWRANSLPEMEADYRQVIERFSPERPVRRWYTTEAVLIWHDTC